ncbi:acetoacetyl-CoA reductase [bacterium]|nr:acetoacetyl-CoA reductase [bacterium]
MGKIALVTGGTRGIGAAIAVALKQAGHKVAVNYATRDSVAQTFTKETGIPAFKWDVADYEACKAGVAQVASELGSTVGILVNNAGITRDGFMHKMTYEQWDSVIRTNLTSCFNMSRAVLESMREKSFGRIVNISSVNAQLGQFGQTNYSAAKSGIFGFTKALARETAAKGITVNAVAPGYVDTEMVQAVSEEVIKTKILPQIPVGRLGKPEEIARTVLFLVDEHAGFITGETISVNGGQHME